MSQNKKITGVPLCLRVLFVVVFGRNFGRVQGGAEMSKNKIAGVPTCLRVLFVVVFG